MELLAQFIGPILSLWVIHNAIFASARFVNKMRETVISGFHDGKAITVGHRETIRLDWRLCMLATVAVCMIFGLLVLLVGGQILEDRRFDWVPFAIAIYPFGCALGFCVCWWSDHKLMKKIEQAGWPIGTESSAAD